MSREYAKVLPSFWTGKTGKALRGDLEAQVLALYLITSPHANMIGVFHCPILYMAHETGLSIDGATKALQRLIEGDFCTFDGEFEVVWVHEMAAYQIGGPLKPEDKQIIGLRRQVEKIQQPEIQQGFVARYSNDFSLIFNPETPGPSEAPPKPLRSQEQEQEQEQDPSPPSKVGESFVRFWAAYPRKQGKGAAEKAWGKARINGEIDSVLTALESQKRSEQWRKDNGQFIPNPATWINQRRWEDEIPGGSHPDGTSSMTTVFGGVV